MSPRLYLNLVRAYGEAVAQDRLSESNRRGYIAQSAATRNGVVAPFPLPAAGAEPPPSGPAAGFFIPNQPEQPA